MALVHADWVKETSTTTGTGTYDLAGAATGFRTFVAGISTGNTCYYSATNGTDWEVGLGTVTDAAPDTLARTTVLSSSNAGAAVNWGAGTKTLVCTIPASKYRAIGEVVLAADLPAATTGAQGAAELLTTTELLTGTDTTRAATADAIAALWEAGADITDGATITIGEGGYFNLITSTTAITAFTITTNKAGRIFRCRFDTARTLTHNATSLILPSSANITTVQGDIAQFRSLGSGNVVCDFYTRKDGTALVGGFTAATQAEQETGTSTTVSVTPGRQHFHPSAAKFWAKCAGAGTLTSSYNMTSVTDTGPGDLDGTIATDFSSADWCLLASVLVPDVDLTTVHNNKVININAQAAGTFGVQNAEWLISSTAIGGQDVNLIDPTTYFIAGFGDI